MFYEFDDDIVSVSAENISKNNVTAGYVNLSELEEIYKSLGFSTIAYEQCRQEFNIFSTGITGFDDFSLVKIYTADGGELALFIRKNLLLIVGINDKGCMVRDAFMQITSTANSQNADEKELTCAFLFEMISKDRQRLVSLRKSISELERDILMGNSRQSFNVELLEINSRLLSLRSYYEQLIDIGEELDFPSFSSKAERLKENIDLLQGSVVHLWDCYQAGLDIKLNERMKAFTLLTTIFFPVTIIVGWYGMNFCNMPELNWRYGYAFVIALTIAVVGILILIFKKKNLI